MEHGTDSRSIYSQNVISKVNFNTFKIMASDHPVNFNNLIKSHMNLHRGKVSWNLRAAQGGLTWSWSFVIVRYFDATLKNII